MANASAVLQVINNPLRIRALLSLCAFVLFRATLPQERAKVNWKEAHSRQRALTRLTAQRSPEQSDCVRNRGVTQVAAPLP